MNEVFKKEWKLYKAAGSRPQFRGLEKRVWPKGFDGPVQVGEIRVFADMNRPFVAPPVLESRDAVGNFRDLTACTVRSGTGLWRRRTGWSIAAMLFICCGIGRLWWNEMANREVLCCAPISMVDVEQEPQPTTERYAEYAENEFLSPKSEPLSTFGLDVDTSSYALMRSSINDQKRLPPKNSVRLEEFVNYFKYGYPQPEGEDPIAVDCELAACPWNAKHRLLRLGVQAKTVKEKNLPPCNLTFLIDVSGSMEWNNGLEMARQGLKMLVGKLRDEDHVAIVTYANGTAVRLPSVSGREKNAIRSVIDGLSASGGTAGGAGIQLAYEEAKKNFDRKANNRVILVTDGDFNIGISSPRELEDFIAAKRESGVFLTVLGVGRGNFQDANMKKLANAGNGNYAFLDSVLEAKKVMMSEFGGTLMTVAKDVKVQIEFNPSEVEGYRLLGYENRRLAAKDFNDDRKDAGEIGSGHTMTAFYEIIPAGTGEMGAGTDPLKYQKCETAKSGELLTVRMRYKKPDGDKSILIEKAHAATEMTRKEPSADFRFASAVAEFALLLEDSKYRGDASFPKLIERARSAKGEDREGYRAEFIRLAEAAEVYNTQEEKSR